MKQFGCSLSVWFLASCVGLAQEIVVPSTDIPGVVYGSSGHNVVPPTGIFSPGHPAIRTYSQPPVQYHDAPTWSAPSVGVHTEIYAPVRRVAPPQPRYAPNLQSLPGYFVVPAPMVFGTQGGFGRPFTDLGFEGFSEPRIRSSMYPAIPYRSTPMDELRSRFHVIVPTETTKVLLDGSTTRQVGLSRYYHTPRLMVGQEYTMRVRAEWTENGEPRASEQLVDFLAGEEVRIDFTRPAARK